MSLNKMFTVLIVISLIFAFASCENDRDRDFTEPKLDLEDISKTYSGSNLIINAELAAQLQKVEVESISEEEVTLKLTNIVEGLAETSFTVPVTKKESGAYAFDYASEVISSEDEQNMWMYKLSGSFVGDVSKNTGIKLIVVYENMKWTTVEDLLSYITYKDAVLPILPPTKRTGRYDRKDLYVDGVATGSSAYVQLKEGTSSGIVDISFASLNFGAGTTSTTVKDIELKRGDKFNTWVFDDFTYESNYNKMVVSGSFDNYKLYLTTKKMSKSKFIGKYSLDFASINVLLNTNDSEKDPIYSKIITDFIKKVAPFVLKDFTLLLKEDGKIDVSYIELKENKIENLELDYYTYLSGKSDLIRLALDRNRIDNLIGKVAQKGYNLNLTDIENVFPSTEAIYSYAQYTMLVEEDSVILTSSASNLIKGWISLFEKLTPKTITEFEKLGVKGITQEEIDELNVVYEYIESKSSLSKGSSIDFGLEQVK